MSKFIDAVQVKMSGQRIPVMEALQPLSAAHKVTDVFHMAPPSLHEHQFMVRWEMRHACRPEEARYVRESFVRQLRDVVYGDARLIMRELHEAIYRMDREKAITALKKLDEEFYG